MSSVSDGSLNFFERKRKLLTGAFLVLGMAFALVTHHSWAPGGTVDIAFDLAGIALVVLGFLGRLWATMFIGGRKNQTLVTAGPYSMCRNPLYFFSFTAGLGICVELENLILLGLYILVFSFYYKSVIKSEEGRLEFLFGEEFVAYKRSTPAFFPKLTGLDLSGPAGISSKLLWKNALDGSIFLLFIPVAYAIERLHESGVIRVLWNIP